MTSKPGIFRSATWAALLYILIDLPWAILAFTVIFTLLWVGIGLPVIYLGIPILMLTVLIARGAAHAQVGLGAALAGWDLHIAKPAAVKRPGLWGVLLTALTDTPMWRAIAYFAIKLFWAPLALGVSAFFYAGLGMATYPAWRQFLPAELGADGQMHRGASLWNGTFIDTWPAIGVYALIGVVLMVVIPYLMRAVLRVDYALAKSVLGATERTS